ncbi:hypothetical protein TTHERM_000653829 (macronuclear) [Tetrahymena thermophila SB210]|uniref:Uncharacterized protein n=1 Tax=Tetrahymena thermophila (strain SB210) TaxID=312017 RepID=W7XBW4_TETTS|nr:hypothetical protein TTHERM_000653829 [Tetrahymena thermophila SB210]EWS74817.1 hypothetical protein TTHERM_000653829 [Tetrahymena thermophila SB210]|eukprot:XP_012652648.1 hypothetical protein TTHERM_000653829 [Tetrahymena thermophila SB210]
MIRNSKSQQTYRKKIQNIGNPFIGQIENNKNVQHNLNSLLLKEDKTENQTQKQQINYDNMNPQHQLMQNQRIQSPQSNRQKKVNSSYNQIIRSENPLHVNGSHINQSPLQNTSTIQQKYLESESTNNISPWVGIKREQIRTASPSQGRKHNIFKDYFNASENIYQMQGFTLKNNQSQLNQQLNSSHSQQIPQQIMQQSLTLQPQNQFSGNSPFFKNNSQPQQGLFFNQAINKPFFQQAQQSQNNQNNFASLNPSLIDQNNLIGFQNQQHFLAIKSRPYSYTSHRMFRPQKLGLVSKLTSNQELKQVTTNNNNSNYYYLTDKNKDWNQAKNNWIGSLSGCLFSQAVKVNDNIQLKNKNISSYSQKKKKYLIKQVSQEHQHFRNQQKDQINPQSLSYLQKTKNQMQSTPQLQISQKMIFNKA